MLHVVRRRAWSIAAWTIVIAVAAGVISYLRTPQYEATAQVLLRPNDPNEALNPVAQAGSYLDPVRNANAQAAVIRSLPVARGASQIVNGRPGPESMIRRIRVDTSGTSNVVGIVARDTDPARAQAVANAFAEAYLQNRRAVAVSALQAAVDDLTTRLSALQEQIGQLDSRIARTSATSGGSTTINSPQGPTPTTSPVTSPKLGVDPGAPATSDEALKAARYAAAVQYQELFSKQQELKVDISLKRGEAELVSGAELPRVPVSPKPVRDAALGAIIGVMFAVGLAFVREQFDDKVRNAADVERAMERPVLAELPVDDAALPTSSAPKGQFAESVRSLRTSVQFLGVDGPLRRIVVTSCNPNDGKTTVAANLAVVYAQAGFRTLLISADLRRPRAETLFGSPPPGRGLSVLLATAAIEPAADERVNGSRGHAVATRDHLLTLLHGNSIETRVENLVVVPAGPLPPNPAELLGSARMRALFEAVESEVDMVIVDSPPALAVTDAVVLGNQCDGVLVVAAASRTTRRDLERLLKTFEAVDVGLLGAVLNRSDRSSESIYYYDTYCEAGASKPARRWSGRRGKPAPAVLFER